MSKKVYPNIDYLIISDNIKNNLNVTFATNVRVLDSSKIWRIVYVESKFKLSTKNDGSDIIKTLIEYSTSFHALVYKVSHLLDSDAASKEPKSKIQIDEKARLNIVELIKQNGLMDELK